MGYLDATTITNSEYQKQKALPTCYNESVGLIVRIDCQRDDY